MALLAQARSWAGSTVDDVTVGGSSGVHKGSVGQRLERALGLKPVFDDVDDPASGVEVKTLPFRIDAAGRPRVTESTFVTSASLSSLIGERWETSRVKKKLTRVLFVPVERVRGERVPGGRLPERGRPGRIGTAFLYEPDDVDEAILRADWEDLADLVARGLGFAISARRGRVLQLRPKAKNAAVMTTAETADGDEIQLRPQGFYLRTRFTQRLVDDRFC